MLQGNRISLRNNRKNDHTLKEKLSFKMGKKMKTQEVENVETTPQSKKIANTTNPIFQYNETKERKTLPSTIQNSNPSSENSKTNSIKRALNILQSEARRDHQDKLVKINPFCLKPEELFEGELTFRGISNKKLLSDVLDQILCKIESMMNILKSILMVRHHFYVKKAKTFKELKENSKNCHILQFFIYLDETSKKLDSTKAELCRSKSIISQI